MTRMGIKLDSKYYFSGMFVMDIKKLKEFRFFDKCMGKTVEKSNELIFPDMDVINALMEGQFAEIDPIWNTTARFSFLRKKVKMWHFVHQTQKPWCNLWKNVTWIPYLKYLLKTPYRSEAFRFIWGHIKGLVFFAYTKNRQKRYLVCGIRVWKKRI